MTALIGYGRVSADDQDLSIQRGQLLGAGVEDFLLFMEQASGTSRKGRPKLEQALLALRPGDVFLVTRLDRLARSAVDLLEILRRVEERKAGFRVLLQPEIDTTTTTGRLVTTILGAVAQFETELRMERQLEGIARAKSEKRYIGSKRRIDPAEVTRLREEGLGATEIAKRLGCDPRTIYRAAPGMWAGLQRVEGA